MLLGVLLRLRVPTVLSVSASPQVLVPITVGNVYRLVMLE
jgi:hypothetical protein